LFDKLFEFTVHYLKSIPKEHTNRIIIVKKTLTSSAHSKHTLHALLNWHTGKNEELKTFEVGIEAEWQIVCLITKSNHFHLEDKAKLFEEQAAKDKSDTQNNNRKFYEAAIIDASGRREELW